MALKLRYFRLLESVGVEPDACVESIDPFNGAPIEVANPRAGELQPLNNVGVRALIPAMVGKQLVREVRHVEVTPDGLYQTIDDNGRSKRVGLPDTSDRVIDAEGRVVALSTQAVIDGVIHSGSFEEIDAPKTKAAAAAKEA